LEARVQVLEQHTALRVEPFLLMQSEACYWNLRTNLAAARHRPEDQAQQVVEVDSTERMRNGSLEEALQQEESLAEVSGPLVEEQHHELQRLDA